MTILADWEIAARCIGMSEPMIEPYFDQQQRFNHAGMPIISCGVSSYGYDIRCANKFKVFSNVYSAVVDPKAFSADAFIDIQGPYCIIPPNSFALAVSVEKLRIPQDVLAICIGKSTYARCGIIVNVTPLEPGWQGYVTLELSNSTPLPVKVYANEGVAQMVFHKANEACRISYSGRQGKYQHQTGITLPRI